MAPVLPRRDYVGAMRDKVMKKLDVHSLMSPPDPVYDNFHHAQNHVTMVNHANIGATIPNGTAGTATNRNDQHRPSKPHSMPMSPPVSPYDKAVDDAVVTPSSTRSQHPVQDPVLYPSEESAPSGSPQPPLFASPEIENQRLVDEHIRVRSPSTFTQTAPPNSADYELVLHFTTRIADLYDKDPRGWKRREMAFLKDDIRLQKSRYATIMPARSSKAGKASPIRPSIAKPQAVASKTDRVSKSSTAAPRKIRNGQKTRPAASRVSATPGPGPGPGAEPSRRVVAPNREDKDFEALPDWCPPLDSLPNKPNCLKIDWRTGVLDLSDDPYRHLLHKEEIICATYLRLDCATYLTTKRRMFIRLVECIRRGKQFRKTDAQQACRIDVNKASKLWVVYDRVGWLNEKWVRQYV